MIELAWAAGFFDGEGCVQPHQGWFRLAVSQIHSEPLERFAEAVGTGRVYGPYGPYGQERNPYWVFKTNTPEESAYVLEQLLPYLCVKDDQARSALAAMKGGESHLLPVPQT